MTKNEAWQRFECWKSPGAERDRACFDAGWDAREADMEEDKRCTCDIGLGLKQEDPTDG